MQQILETYMTHTTHKIFSQSFAQRTEFLYISTVLIYASALPARGRFRSPQNMRQPFSGTAEQIFMKLLPNDRGEMEFPTPYPNGAKPPKSLVPENFFGG